MKINMIASNDQVINIQLPTDNLCSVNLLKRFCKLYNVILAIKYSKLILEYLEIWWEYKILIIVIY